MAAHDKFHDAVRAGLEKDGWTVTDDPLYVVLVDKEMEIDLGAERLLGAVKGLERIAVEIKSFLAPSHQYEFYHVLGQFLSYREGLQVTDPERVLYLAITNDVFDAFFQTGFAQWMVNRYQLKLLVYDQRKEVLVQWIN